MMNINWLKENWAGIIGIIILALGVVYGAIYLGLHASTFWSFAQLIGVGLVFLCASLVLKRQSIWHDLSVWMLVASGSVVLLTVVGAPHFEAIKFYESNTIWLTMLVLALAYNVVLAYISESQPVACLLLSINILALCAAPLNPVVLFLAVTVAIISIVFGLKQAWHYVPVVIVAGYTVLYSVWFAKLLADNNQWMYASMLISAIAISLFALLCYYNKLYRNQPPQTTLFAYSTIWILMGLQVIWYINTIDWRFLPLCLIATVGLGLGFLARNKKPYGLYFTNLLASQIFIVSAVFAIQLQNIEIPFVLWLAAIESLVFALITYYTQDKVLSIIGGWFSFLFAALFSILMIIEAYSPLYTLLSYGTSAALFYLARCLLSYPNQSENKNKLGQWPQHFQIVLDTIILWYASLIIWIVLEHFIIGFAGFCLVLAAMFYNKKLSSHQSHQICLWAIWGQLLLYNWVVVISAQQQAIQLSMQYSLPSMLLIIFLYQIVSAKTYWVYLLSAHLAIVGSALTQAWHPILPGIYLLALGMGFFSISQWLKNSKQEYQAVQVQVANGAQNSGYAYLMLFVLLYLLYFLFNDTMLFGLFSTRIVLGISAIVICLYFYFHVPCVHENAQWRQRLQQSPFDFAVILAFTLILVVLNTSVKPIGYGLLALALTMPALTHLWPIRKLSYSLILLYALSIQAGIISVEQHTVLSDSYLIAGLILGFIVAGCYLKAINSARTHYPVQYEPILISLMPLFISTAMFLYWRFDAAYLTLFWTIEAFMIAITGFILQHMRLLHLAWGGLVLCVLKLLFYDLAQTDLLVRALVFITVGLLMVAFHLLYKKYGTHLKSLD